MDGRGSRARRAALAAAAALALVTAARLPAAWESGNALNHVSGVWLGLADDLARGTLYRPLADGDAYGGTRYFPAVFAAQAALVRAGVPLVEAGLAVSLAAGLLLAAGVALLAAGAGARPADALAAAALAFAGAAGQLALANARGDLLPVALSALALALVDRRARPLAGALPRLHAANGSALAAPPRPPALRVWLAALLLVAAFAAKPTALTAAAAAVLALWLRGARRAALLLAAGVAAGAAGVVLATDALSAGRFLASLGATGAAGVGPRTVLAAPVRLVTEAVREDPAGLALVLLGAAALAAAAPALSRAVRPAGPGRAAAGAAPRRGAHDPRLVPALWLALAGAAAVGVYTAPGTGANHLLEVEAASAALLAASAAGARGRRAALVRAACAAVALAGAAGALALWRDDRTGSRLADARAVLRALPPGPVVSEDPLVPLLAGASPLVLDPFAVRGPAAVAAPLAAALRAGAFPAVVLLADVDAPAAREWYGRGNLGLSLVAAIRAGYRPAGAFGRYHLYLPRRGPPDAGVVRRDGAG